MECGLSSAALFSGVTRTRFCLIPSSPPQCPKGSCCLPSPFLANGCREPFALCECCCCCRCLTFFPFDTHAHAYQRRCEHLRARTLVSFSVCVSSVLVRVWPYVEKKNFLHLACLQAFCTVARIFTAPRRLLAAQFTWKNPAREVPGERPLSCLFGVA